MRIGGPTRTFQYVLCYAFGRHIVKVSSRGVGEFVHISWKSNSIPTAVCRCLLASSAGWRVIPNTASAKQRHTYLLLLWPNTECDENGEPDRHGRHGGAAPCDTRSPSQRRPVAATAVIGTGRSIFAPAATPGPMASIHTRRQDSGGSVEAASRRGWGGSSTATPTIQLPPQRSNCHSNDGTCRYEAGSGCC